MKFANIIYNKNRGEKATIGDDIQLLAIEYLYHYMGIDYEEVIRIERADLQTYDGEDVILPISFPFISYYDDMTITCFSEKITPVFLGVCILSQELNEKDINYLKCYAPIGCRDEYTYETMKKHNISAYLNGCMTLILPKAERNIDDVKKIFCVDVQEELIPFIPLEIRERCEFTSHFYFIRGIKENPEDYARKIYERYKKEAKLVITSLLHAAIPCMAAGIPVVFAKDKFSYRFAGVDKIARFYDRKEFSNIDWNPEVIDYEDRKKALLELASQRIWSVYNTHTQISAWDSYMKTRKKREWLVDFIDNTIEYIQQNWDKNDSIEYALWGVSQVATNIYNYVTKNYPNAKLTAVVDREKKISIFGLKSDNKYILKNRIPSYVFVCAVSAVEEAKVFLAEIGVNTFYNCCEKREERTAKAHSLSYVSD